MNKVCFIGQSGTGKTSILELIPYYLFNYDTQLIQKGGYEAFFDKAYITVRYGHESEYETEISQSKNEAKPEWGWNENKLNGIETEFEDAIKFFDEFWTKEVSTKLIYFPANLNYEIDDKVEGDFKDAKIIDFSKEKVSKVWNIILESIESYQLKELQIRQEISKTVEQASNNLDTIKVALKKLEDWKRTEFNPIQDVADNSLNKLLERYKLRVKTELDIKEKDDIGFIKIEDYDGNEIPNGLWSTGTKQIILSALPLYLLKPKHTVILFDEPERSLYPDIQRFIIDYYTSLTDNCQFFYSTHSPIIASSFDPWEIVELKFNEEGKVERELYYEGENHVDNYKINPKYMRWDDILQRVFDLENDGSEARKQKLDELATYNVKYRKLEKNGKKDSEEAVEIAKKIEQLSKELSNWN